MAAFKLPRFDRSIPVVEENRTPTFAFQQWWDLTLKRIETAITDIQNAQAAADAARAAASDAQAAADAAQTAANTAQSAADDAGAVSKLSGSGVSGLTLEGVDAGTDARITISAHTRVYSDGTSVAVNAGLVTGLAYTTTYYVYYDDATFAGGAVTYAATTSDVTAAQTGGRHLVGSVLTPASGAAITTGKKILPPGVSGIEP